jgi:2-polyprenyl-3-methyl-5-hydroxy-6-metoxy-1,4-benzoquinol methylase
VAAPSPRLRAILDALPLRDGVRVLEVGCGPGVLARAMVARGGFVLGLDRSATAIRQALAGSATEVATGRLAFREGAIETFALAPDESPFDLAVANRVGVLDGRHPEGEAQALAALARALAPEGRLFVDGQERLLPRA